MITSFSLAALTKNFNGKSLAAVFLEFCKLFCFVSLEKQNLPNWSSGVTAIWISSNLVKAFRRNLSFLLKK